MTHIYSSILFKHKMAHNPSFNLTPNYRKQGSLCLGLAQPVRSHHSASTITSPHITFSHRNSEFPFPLQEANCMFISLSFPSLSLLYYLINLFETLTFVGKFLVVHFLPNFLLNYPLLYSNLLLPVTSATYHYIPIIHFILYLTYLII